MKKYSIGLDIGTNSVGWAVVTENRELIRRRMPVINETTGEVKKVKKNFWGVRLFDDGETAENRRLKRTTRRRISRRKNRLKKLQSIFAKDMEKCDENFFMRLEDSFLVEEDKRGERHPFFGSLQEELRYHQDYPTIYHLRKAVADATEQMDLRLIYLAMAHTIKFRGHFLIEGKLDTDNISVDETFQSFVNEYNQRFTKQEDGSYINFVDPTISVKSIFEEKNSRTKKMENVIALFPEKKKNGDFALFVKLIVGNQADFKKLFNLEESFKLQFSKEEYEEELETLLQEVGDEYADLFDLAKKTYDAVELSKILHETDMPTKAKLSANMIKRYDVHKADLKRLKEFIRKNEPAKYAIFFKDTTKDGYAGYIDGKTKQEDFYKFVKKELGEQPGSEYFLKKVEQEDFLRKQRVFDNGVIPNQVHLDELEAMIASQKEFYPFLKERKDEIINLLTFRIPYYVGPLSNGESNFGWLIRKEAGAITPENIENNVDMGKTTTAFVERMTNYDTYLPNEKVLPKHSMIYELYTVANELTKVSYTTEQSELMNFSSYEKKKIIKDLFKKNRNVTKKMLESYLVNEFGMDDPEIKGIDKKFLAKLGTYHDLLQVGVSADFLDDPQNEDALEELIKTLTIFEDRKMLRKQLKQFENILSSKTLKDLERKHYTGWGRLSKKILVGIREKQSKKTILEYLLDDDGGKKNINRNFMQLINDKDLSFAEQIAECQQDSDNQASDINEIVDGLAGSPAIKKGIRQTLKIVDEIVRIMGTKPERIVVEMARENRVTSKTKTRMKILEEKLAELGSQILKENPTTNEALKRDALFLYYLQDGKDMYTGEPLDINFLSQYDIDHIIPQSFTTDNSIDNRVLTTSKGNRGKSDNVPDEKVVRKMDTFWRSLKKSGLISERKYSNLTKKELTEADKAGFIARQLVETRQITKNVARLLHERMNDQKESKSKVQIVTLKSALVSQFRKQFKIYKVREINDYHHAHDAYLNAVVSGLLLNVYPKLQSEFVYGEYAKVNVFSESKATAKKQFYTNIMSFFRTKEKVVNEDGELLWSNTWIGDIKKVIESKQMNIVKKVEMQTGRFSEETILPKGKSEKLIPRKNNWPTDKYGGLGSPTQAYTILFTHEKGKQKKVTNEFLGITIMERESFEKNPISFLEERGYENPIFKIKMAKYSLVEMKDGRRRMLASSNEAQKGNQLILNSKQNKLLFHAKKCDKFDESLKYLSEHRIEFEELLNHLLEYIDKYVIAKNQSKKIREIFDKNSHSDLKEVASSFIELLKITFIGAPSDFKFFGETIGRKRYLGISEFSSGTLINQSITGLYESRRELSE